jgi:hypothetical protein
MIFRQSCRHFYICIDAHIYTCTLTEKSSHALTLIYTKVYTHSTDAHMHTDEKILTCTHIIQTHT